MSGTLKVGGKTLATHDTNTNVAKIQLGSTSDVVLTDSAGNNVLSESGGVVTLTADTAIIEGSSSGDLVRITQTGSGNALVVEDSANPDATPFIIDASGNVAIKTYVDATSTLSLDVIQSNTTSFSGTGYRVARFASTFAANADQPGVVLGYDTAGAGIIAAATQSTGQPLAFWTYNGSAWAERMRIDSSGNVLVGATYSTPAESGASGNYGVSLRTGASSQISVNGTEALWLNRDSSDGDILRFRRSLTGVGSISVTSSTTAYNTSSDYRLKENITGITDGISRVKQLNPSRFNFIADPNTTVDGFLAHEVQDIVPEAISGEKDAVNEDGSIDPQGIDQSKLVPLLTAALQEAIALIESQQSQIEALTARIEALEATP